MQKRFFITEIINKMKTILLLIVLLPVILFSQETNIVPLLREIESGNSSQAKKGLAELLVTKSGDPSVIFLDAVLSENASEALNKYLIINQKYPKSKYADAALYRIFMYYFSAGSYSRANEYLAELKRNYPESQYITMADRNIPEEELLSDQLVVSNTTEKISETPADIPFKFTIQAGAFLNYSNAASLKSRFENSGLPSSIFTKEVGGSILNVVTAGKFTAEADAVKTLAEIEKQFNLKGRVIQIEEAK